MNFQFAKAGGKVNMLLRGHRLIAKKDDLVFVQGLADVINDGLGEIGREINTADLGANGCAKAFDVKVVPRQLGKTSPLVGEVQDWTNPFATKGLAIFGDIRARVFDSDDVGVSSSRLHKSPKDPSF